MKRLIKQNCAEVYLTLEGNWDGIERAYSFPDIESVYIAARLYNLRGVVFVLRFDEPATQEDVVVPLR